MFNRNTARKENIQIEPNPSSSPSTDSGQALRMTRETTTEWMNQFSRLLVTTPQEESEIKEQGHSFTTLVKDLYRIIHRDFISNGFSIEEIRAIFELWDKPPFYIAEKLKLDEAKSYHLNQIYFGAKDYLAKQLETLIGETLIAASPKNITDASLSDFVKTNQLKQRVFSYSLNQNQMYQMIMGAYNSFRVKNNERELVELINLIKIFLGNSQIDEEFKSKLIDELRKAGIDIYQLIEFPIQSENFIVEVSPPYENYSFQKDVMVRIYSVKGNQTEIEQFVVPNSNPEEVLKYIEELNGKNQTKAVSNRVLSNMIFARTSELKSAVLDNVLRTLVRHPDPSSPLRMTSGSPLELLRKNDKLLSPIKSDVEKTLVPFVTTFFSQLGKIHKPEFFETAVNNLNDFIFHLNSKYDDRLKLKDKKLQKEIREGKHLDKFRNPLLSISTAPQVQASYSGGCNSLSSSKSAEAKTTDLSKASTQTVAGKNGETLQFKTVKSADGSEEKYILCPVCRKGYFDVCALDRKCEYCQNTGTSVYENYESGSLESLRAKYSKGGGIISSAKKAYPESNHNSEVGPSLAGNFGVGVISIFQGFLESIFGFASN